jgi:hypothetical protein
MISLPHSASQVLGLHACGTMMPVWFFFFLPFFNANMCRTPSSLTFVRNTVSFGSVYLLAPSYLREYYLCHCLVFQSATLFKAGSLPCLYVSACLGKSLWWNFPLGILEEPLTLTKQLIPFFSYILENKWIHKLWLCALFWDRFWERTSLFGR